MRILLSGLFYWMLIMVSCISSPNNKEIENKPKLKGKWLISSSFGAQCNVCPELEFLNSNKGIITIPSKKRYDFEYKGGKI